MKLSEVHEVKRKEIHRRFELPKDTTDVLVDEFFRPYKQDGGKMMYSLKRTAISGRGFHQHELKSN